MGETLEADKQLRSTGEGFAAFLFGTDEQGHFRAVIYKIRNLPRAAQ